MDQIASTDYLSIFKNKRVMITGHTGFKGSWLAFLLNKIGAEVLGYALPPIQKKSHFNLLELDELIHHEEADINDNKKLTSIMKTFRPQFVFHLAAQALVRPSYANPRQTFETNIMGSVNLLEAVRECDSIRSLIFVTSDKCYENNEWIWGYRENDRLGGHDPYSASKASAEIVFSAYTRSFFFEMPHLGTASTRAGNVIGGGDWSVDRIIPDCVRAIQSNLPINLRNPNATRPWQHVLEPLSGYLLLASRLFEEPTTYSGAWNFGPPSSGIRTVSEVTQRMILNFGHGKAIFSENMNHHEAQLLQLNCDKANQLLGWYSRWSVEETIDKTSDWYIQFHNNRNTRDISSEQIHEYFPEIN